jgi:hypothetical protein
LYNRNEESCFDASIFNENDPIRCDPKLGDAVTPAETQRAIQKMKTEKAPGKNGLSPEAYKSLAGLGEDVLEKIITDVWINPDFNPEIWTHIVLLILPKSGDLSNPNT